MTAKQYRNAIAKLGLSQQRSGVFFGYSPRHGQRFASGESEVPVAVSYLIKMMLDTGTMPGQLDPEFKKVALPGKTFA
jgi:hypothetical protein